MTKKHQFEGERAKLTPNHFPNPVTEEELGAAAAMCRYLGGLYPEGYEICYEDNKKWRCSAGQWTPTGTDC